MDRIPQLTYHGKRRGWRGEYSVTDLVVVSSDLYHVYHGQISVKDCQSCSAGVYMSF